MPSVTRSAARKAKDDKNNKLSAKKNGGKSTCGKTADSSSALPDTKLSRSARGTKKEDSSSPSPSLRKSERLLNISLDNSHLKKTPKSKKKRSMPHSPTKLEKHNRQHCSSSAHAKRSEKVSFTVGSKESGKITASLKSNNHNLDGNEQIHLCQREGSSTKIGLKEEEIQLADSAEQSRKKRFDARSYRKFLVAQVMMASSPGNSSFSEGKVWLLESDETSNLEVCKDTMDGSNIRKEKDLKVRDASNRNEEDIKLSGCLGIEVTNFNRKDRNLSKSVCQSDKELCLPSISKIPLPCSSNGLDVKESQRVEVLEMAKVLDLATRALPDAGPIFVTSSEMIVECSIPETRDASESVSKTGYNNSTFSSSTRDVTNNIIKSRFGNYHEKPVDACPAYDKPKRCCNAKGCLRSYYLSCSDPSLSVIPLGARYCQLCILKMVKFGVHSVSPGIEIICDVRETADGRGNPEKQYLVKYKGLAYVHNCWLPEGQLLEEAPVLLDDFKKKVHLNKAINCNSDWVVPQRLLGRRSALVSEEMDHLVEQEFISYPCEWLVKWKGLGYEYATWELETASFLSSPEAMTLKSDFEGRIKKAKEYSQCQRAEKLLNARKGPLPTVSELPVVGSDTEYLTFVNKILGRWYKCQNAVVIDVKERISKTVFFILSLKPCVSLPVLIISTFQQIIHWEAEFLKLDPSLNVVVYVGEKNVRRNIEMLEFYEDGGSVMIEVLLSTPNAIIEDLDSFKGIGCWGVVVVDDYYDSRMWEHLDQLRNLTADFKLLLTGGQIKDNAAECINLLSFLDAVNDEDLCENAIVATLPLLKKKLTQLVAFEHKTSASKFLEHWVPVPLSDVQLEQYCHTILENFTTLRSFLRSDPIGVLSDVLHSLRKCCEHPYLLDPGLQASLTKSLQAAEFLQAGINASGKLRLLDKILSEMKNQGLRVLILFQSVIGSNKVSIGDILDDFLRQRFGGETYERIDGGLVKVKRDAATNVFNSNKEQRFALLLENRACRSLIKLSSIDAIIIFGSEWNPLNDLRALMKIQIDSGSERLKVFRLYTPFTVEEKALLMMNQDSANLDFSSQSITPATSHAMLKWGASFLFKKLGEFHELSDSTTTSGTFSCGVNLDDVVREVLNEVHQDNLASKSSSKPLLTKVWCNGATYIHNGSLVGDAELELKDCEVSPASFWCKLLEGRSPRWKYLSESLQRTRKRAKHYDEIDDQEVGKEKVRKCQKLANCTVEPVTLKTWIERQKQKAICREKNVDLSSPVSSLGRTHSGSVGPKKRGAFAGDINNRVEGTPRSDTMQSPTSASEAADISALESEGSRKLRDGQKSLYILLKPEISRICHALPLPEHVKEKAEMLLEYVIHNHHVTREPKAILEAFLLSLCWRAASLTRFKVNHKESLLRAKKLLGFGCEEHEADFVYLMICKISKRFSKDMYLPKDTLGMNSPEKQSVAGTDQMLANDFRVSISQQGLMGDKEESNPSSKSHSDQVLVDHPQVISDEGEDLGQEIVEMSSSEKVSEVCTRVVQICHARNQQIFERQHNEIQLFNELREELSKNVKNKYGSEVCLSRKLSKLVGHMDKCFRTLVDKQRKEKLAEKKIKAQWLLEARAGSLRDSFDELPLSVLPFNIDEIRISGEESAECDGLNDRVPLSCNSYPSFERDDAGPNQLMPGRETTCELMQQGLSKEGACVEKSVQLSSSGNRECQVSLMDNGNSRGGDKECLEGPDLRCMMPSATEQHTVSMTVPLPSESYNSGSARTNDCDVLQTDEPICSQQDDMPVQNTLVGPTAHFSQLEPSGGSQALLITTAADAIRNGIVMEHGRLPQQSNGMIATERPQPFPADPLQNEMEKILRQKELYTNMTDDEKKRLESERAREIEEINKKYDAFVQAAELRLQQTHRLLDTNYRRICLNRILAEAYKYRSINHKSSSQATKRMAHAAQQASSNGAVVRAVAPHLQTYRPSAISREAAPSSLSDELLMQMEGRSTSAPPNLGPANSDPLSHHGPSFDAWLISNSLVDSSASIGPAVGDANVTSEAFNLSNGL